ncbi:MAG: extracellular solute-binding protein, partial [Acidimicrobiia bacterium]|nr:extracellular solute-binding protein [Acidimicrobiia bacterium]
MTTKRFSWLALLAALAMIVAACGGGETASEETTAETTATTAAPEPATTVAEETTTTEAAPAAELVVWADANRSPVVEAIAPAFEEATGVSIKVEVQDFGQIKDLATTAAPAGEGPDVFIGAHDWTGELVANGIVEPVDLSSVESNLDPQAIAAFTVDGTTYGLPV